MVQELFPINYFVLWISSADLLNTRFFRSCFTFFVNFQLRSVEYFLVFLFFLIFSKVSTQNIVVL